MACSEEELQQTQMIFLFGALRQCTYLITCN